MVSLSAAGGAPAVEACAFIEYLKQPWTRSM
jgi:hypothetical protein